MIHQANAIYLELVSVHSVARGTAEVTLMYVCSALFYQERLGFRVWYGEWRRGYQA